MFNFKPLLILSILLFPFVAAGATDDLAVRIVSYTREVPLGAPPLVTFEIKNRSGHPVTIVHAITGFDYQLVVRRADGTPRLIKGKGGSMEPCDKGADAQFVGNTVEVLSVDWNRNGTMNLSCDARPGELIVYLMASSRGPYEKDYLGRSIDDPKVWSGEIKTPEIRIKIVEPTGIDREAYEAFKHRPDNHTEEILARYPKSTYAAYFLLGKGYTVLNPSYLIDPDTGKEFDPERELGLYSEAINNHKSCSECLKSDLQRFQDVVDPLEKLVQNFPDFPFRNRAIYGLVRAYLRLGTPEKAAPLLKELIKNFPDSDEAKKAPAYIAVLKKHGIITE